VGKGLEAFHLHCHCSDYLLLSAMTVSVNAFMKQEDGRYETFSEWISTVTPFSRFKE
jgi:hypothetical protein